MEKNLCILFHWVQTYIDKEWVGDISNLDNGVNTEVCDEKSSGVWYSKGGSDTDERSKSELSTDAADRFSDDRDGKETIIS